jgi:hypothetical protein
MTHQSHAAELQTLTLPGRQEPTVTEIANVAGPRPKGRELKILTGRRQLVQSNVEIKISLVGDELNPSRKQSADLGGCGKLVTHKNKPVAGIQGLVEDTSGGMRSTSLRSARLIVSGMDVSSVGLASASRYVSPDFALVRCNRHAELAIPASVLLIVVEEKDPSRVFGRDVLREDYGCELTSSRR